MMTMGCTPPNGKSIGQWINNQVLSQFGDCDPPAAMYISMDLDGLDPAFAPAVAHIEPGGLSTRQVLDAIAEINAEIIAADVVELLPSADTANGITARVGAKIIREIAAAMIH
jgi:arginase family enzyme